MQLTDQLWHRLLHQPYQLAVPVDKGTGPTIVLLHGIAADYSIWGDLLEYLERRHVRVIALDLLGFGDSPKPDAIAYTMHDHARAVMHTLNQLAIDGRIILVGHSLGSLISTELARRWPGTFEELILCSPPIFTDDVTEKTAQWQKSFYNKAYLALIKESAFSDRAAELVMKFQPKMQGFELSPDTWRAFRLTMRNTILRQSTYRDLIRIKIRTTILYGRFDMLVIRKPLEKVAEANRNIKLKLLPEPHEITLGYSHEVIKVIDRILKHHPKSGASHG